MSWFGADSAGLIQERWAHDFSIGSWSVLDEVTGVFLFSFASITAHNAKGCGSNGLLGVVVGVVSGVRRRHCILCLFAISLMYVLFEENHFNFFQILNDLRHHHFFYISSSTTTSSYVSKSENDARNSSKSFSVMSLSFPRGAIGVFNGAS